MGSESGWVGRPGPEPLTGQRQEFTTLIARGVSNSEACRAVGVQSAHRDTLAVRAHGRIQFGCRAALSTYDHHDGVVVGEVLVRG